MGKKINQPLALHVAIVLSSEHVTALRSPPGSNATDHTVESCPPSAAVTVCAQLQSSPPGSSSQTSTKCLRTVRRGSSVFNYCIELSKTVSRVSRDH